VVSRENREACGFSRGSCHALLLLLVFAAGSFIGFLLCATIVALDGYDGGHDK